MTGLRRPPSVRGVAQQGRQVGSLGGRTTRAISWPSRSSTSVGQSLTRKLRPSAWPGPSSTLAQQRTGCQCLGQRGLGRTAMAAPAGAEFQQGQPRQGIHFGTRGRFRLAEVGLSCGHGRVIFFCDEKCLLRLTLLHFKLPKISLSRCAALARCAHANARRMAPNTGRPLWCAGYSVCTAAPRATDPASGLTGRYGDGLVDMMNTVFASNTRMPNRDCKRRCTSFCRFDQTRQPSLFCRLAWYGQDRRSSTLS